MPRFYFFLTLTCILTYITYIYHPSLAAFYNFYLTKVLRPISYSNKLTKQGSKWLGKELIINLIQYIDNWIHVGYIILELPVKVYDNGDNFKTSNSSEGNYAGPDKVVRFDKILHWLHQVDQMSCSCNCSFSTVLT